MDSRVPEKIFKCQGTKEHFSGKRVTHFINFKKGFVTSPPKEEKQVDRVLKFKFLVGSKAIDFWLNPAFLTQSPVRLLQPMCQAQHFPNLLATRMTRALGENRFCGPSPADSDSEGLSGGIGVGVEGARGICMSQTGGSHGGTAG